MSGRPLAFHVVLVLRLERLRKAAARAMQSNPGRVARTADDEGDLARVQPFPGDQGKQLAVRRPQTRERRGNGAGLLLGHSVGPGRGLVGETAPEARASLLGA